MKRFKYKEIKRENEYSILTYQTNEQDIRVETSETAFIITDMKYSNVLRVEKGAFHYIDDNLLPGLIAFDASKNFAQAIQNWRINYLAGTDGNKPEFIILHRDRGIQFFKSNKPGILLKSFLAGEPLQQGTVSKDNEVHVTIKNKYGRNEFLLNVTPTNITAMFLVEFRSTEVSVDITPTSSWQAISFDYWHVRYREACNDLIIVELISGPEYYKEEKE